MFSKKTILSFVILFIISLLFLTLSFFPDYSYHLVESLLRMKLNTERWLPVIGKLLIAVSLFFLTLSFIFLFLSKIQKFYSRHNILFYSIVFILIALLCRLAGLNYESGDYTACLKPWFDTFKEKGINAFQSDVGDYPVIYKYFIFLFTLIPTSPLYSYKLFSIIFDFLLAIYSGIFIFKATSSKSKALLCYATVLFLPNFMFNSSVWGQCDSIFSFFVLLSCYHLYLKNEKKCIIYYTIAFCFKIQAIFFLPVLVVCLLKKTLKIKTLILFPAVYLVVVLPAIFFGMAPLYALFGSYLKNITSYQSINFNAPNIYMMFNQDFLDSNINFLLIGLTMAICAIIAFIFTNNKSNDSKKLILLSYTFTLVVPFILPHMHERYFYLSDVFAILFAFIYVKYSYISILTIFSSLPGLIQYLFGVNNGLNFVFISYIMFTGVVLLFRVLYKEVQFESEEKQ